MAKRQVLGPLQSWFLKVVPVCGWYVQGAWRGSPSSSLDTCQTERKGKKQKKMFKQWQKSTFMSWHEVNAVIKNIPLHISVNWITRGTTNSWTIFSKKCLIDCYYWACWPKAIAVSASFQVDAIAKCVIFFIKIFKSEINTDMIKI